MKVYFSERETHKTHDEWYFRITNLCSSTYTKSFNMPVSIDSLHIYWKGIMYDSIQQTIRFSIWKISHIVCAPPFWTLLIRWYPDCVFNNNEK